MKYRIIRSSRKSISLSVSPENEVTVRCNYKTPEKVIQKFVDSKIDWLNKILVTIEKKLSSNKNILEYREILVCGEKLPLIKSDKSEITAQAVYIKNIADVKKIFINYFSCGLIELAKNISERINLRANGFSVKSYKSRWACCDRNGKITFNYLLCMLPKHLQLYVIVHELCHTVYFNHSKSFWSLVESILPDCKDYRKQLKSYDFITKLY